MAQQQFVKFGGATVEWDAQGAFVIKAGKRIPVKLPATARPGVQTPQAPAVSAPVQPRPVLAPVAAPAAPVAPAPAVEFEAKSDQETSKLEDTVRALAAQMAVMHREVLKLQGQVALLSEKLRVAEAKANPAPAAWPTKLQPAHGEPDVLEGDGGPEPDLEDLKF
jgi:uncharacterized coiled-coil protein SlyX